MITKIHSTSDPKQARLLFFLHLDYFFFQIRDPVDQWHMLGQIRHQSVCFIVIIFKIFLSYVLYLLKVLPLFKALIVIQGLAPVLEFVSYEFILYDPVFGQNK